MTKYTELYTDGSYNPKKDIGGYAAYIPEEDSVVIGKEEHTTNNQMELQAVISGLTYLKDKDHIVVYSDSQYVCNCATKWINNWYDNDWKTSKGTDVKNKDLLVKLHQCIKQHKSVEFKWVKGHEDNRNNNLCDAFASSMTY